MIIYSIYKYIYIKIFKFNNYMYQILVMKYIGKKISKSILAIKIRVKI